MLKKTVNYEDFDGNKRTEDLYFHLTKTELVEMSMDIPEDLIDSVGDDPSKVDEEAVARKIIAMLGNKGVFEFVKTIVTKAYGVKSPDGRRFDKSEEITRDFTQTLAFDAVLMDLMSDDTLAAEFINSVMAVGGNKPALPNK